MSEAVQLDLIPSALDDMPAPKAEAAKPLDLTDKSTVKALHKEARFQERRFRDTLKAIMGNTEGRNFIRTLIYDWCGKERHEFFSDPHQMYFDQGAKNIGNKLFAEVISNCPDEFLAMLKENENG